MEHVGRGRQREERKRSSRRQLADLLLLLAQLVQHLGMNVEVPDSQHDCGGTGVTPSKQQVQACVLHYQHHPVELETSTIARKLPDT